MNSLTAFGPATPDSRVCLSSSVPLVRRGSGVALPWSPAGHSSCSCTGQCRQEGDCGAEHCASHCVLTPALCISCSLVQLRAAKQFIQWLMKMEIWIKAYLSRRGWGNACRRNQLLHFCLAEDVVLAPPSRNSILWCFPDTLLLWFCFVFYILDTYWS